jgi:retron-type reverse transcriptase
LIGSPQGAVILPLLSNIYLHPLDVYWEREGKGHEDGSLRR